MELLKLVRKRTFLSEFAYTALNIALAVAVLLAVRYTETIWLAIGLVLLSKWRVFAVRPRYWWPNIRSNLVDFIVSVSVVLQMNVVNVSQVADQTKLIILILMTLLYVAWLLVLKPRSKRMYMVAQSGIALFLGSSALFTLAYHWPVSSVVMAMWLLGYATVRHILMSYDNETHPLFLSLVGGLIMAELAWVSYHWAIAYPIPTLSELMLPQISIIVMLVAFLGFKIYDSFYHYARVRITDVLLPLLFTTSALAVLLILFDGILTTI